MWSLDFGIWIYDVIVLKMFGFVDLEFKVFFLFLPLDSAVWIRSIYISPKNDPLWEAYH